MEERFERTRLLLGEAAMEKLKRSRVAVFGLGGVGGHAAEALARSGVGRLDLIDSDRVSRSNINRQIIATEQTLGRYKADVMRERILEINPLAQVQAHRIFFLPGQDGGIDFSRFDYVVDAVDTVTAKLGIVMAALENGRPVISCMGAGNKLDASLLRVADLSETSGCPLAKVMRRELRKRGVEHLKVVYSPERPIEVRLPEPEGETSPSKPLEETRSLGQRPDGGAAESAEKAEGRRRVPGSCAFVPAVAGLLLAGEVVLDLTGARGGQRKQSG